MSPTSEKSESTQTAAARPGRPRLGEQLELSVEGLARFATFRDPDGNPVQIIEYRR